jgi:3',5'-cyclic AMP phosphodiesterase CpdA
VRIFALDSNYMDKPQLEWFEKELQASGSDWKIAFFHHPIYSSGGAHGSDVQLREELEPLFLKYGVDAVFAGHEHFYERIKPQKGIYYFTSGGAAKLREGDVATHSELTAKSFDSGYHFMLVEVGKDSMSFEVVTDQAKIADSGTLPRFNDQEKKRLAGL